MRTSKNATRLGAGVLAAATVVAGLSFGPAAANAAEPMSMKVVDTFQAKIAFDMPNTNSALALRTENGVGIHRVYGSDDLAMQNAHVNKITRYSDGSFTIQDSEPTDTYFGMKDSCYLVETSRVGVKWSACSGTTLNERFILNPNGTLAAFDNQKREVGGYRTGSADYWLHWVNSPGGYKVMSDNLERFEGLTANVSDVDVRGRTATLTGTAAPGSTVIINDADSVTADADGKWTFAVLDLKLGTNTIKVEEYLSDNTKAAELSLDVDLDIAELTASAVFSTNVEDKLRITGTAQEGASVEIYQGSTRITTVPTEDGTGRFSAEIAAPNAGGVQTYTVKQRLDGEIAAQTVEVKADFGAAVTITKPVDDGIHDGGAIRFQGRGTPGAVVELREQGKNGVIGATSVLPSGIWTIDLTNLSGKNAVYEMTQRSKGNNVTAAQVHLNPDVSNTAPLAITTPADGATLTQDSNRVAFAGTGEPGAKVTVKAGSREVFTATVGANGQWVGAGNLAYDVNYVLNTEYTPAGEPVQTGTHRVSVKHAGVSGPFVLTAPGNGATIVAPDNKVTFTGTGTTGANIEVKASNGRVLGTAKVGSDGKWSVTGMLAHNVMYDITVTSTGTATGSINTKVKLVAQDGVSQPLSLTSPADQATLIAPDNKVTFTGQGTTGAQIEVKVSGGRVVGTATVNQAGNWSVTGMLAHDLMYDIAITSTGTAVGTLNTHVRLLSGVVIKPFTVAQSGDLAPVAAGTYEFSGTGAAGARVQLFNYWNGADVRDLFAGKDVIVKEDGTWSAQGQLVVGNQYQLRAAMGAGPDGGAAAEQFITVTGR